MRRKRNYAKTLACFLAAALMLLNVPGMEASAEEPENMGNRENECVCGTRCTKDTANGDCPVCGGTDAEFSLCRGEEPDAAVENVQKLIGALPAAGDLSAMSQAEQQTVYSDLYEAYDAYNALSDEQKKQLSGAGIFDSLFEAFNKMNAPMADGDREVTTGGTYIGLDLVDGLNMGDSLIFNGDADTTFTIMGDLILPVGVSLEIKGGNVSVQGDVILEFADLIISGGTLSAWGNVTATGGELVISGGTLSTGGNVTTTLALKISGGTLSAGGNVTGVRLGIDSSTVTAQNIQTKGMYLGDFKISITDSIVLVSDEISSIVVPANEYSQCGVTVNGDSVVFANGIKKQNEYAGDDSPQDVTSFDNGVVFVGSDGKVYGNVQIPGDVTIPIGYTLTIPGNAGLTIPAGEKLTNNGMIIVESGGTLTVNGDVDGTGNLTNNGGTVNRKEQVQPVAPVLSGTAAADSMTIQSAAGQMYTITETNDTPEVSANARAAIWQRADGDSLTFSDLKAGTTYYIWTYIPGNDYYEDSPVSAALSVSTLKETEGGETTEGDGGTKTDNGDTRYGKNVQTGVEEDTTLWAGLLAFSALLVTLSVIAGRKRKV